MFVYLYDWIRNIAFFMILITAVFHTLPDDKYQKYLRLFTGIVLVMLLAAPILQFLGKGNQLLDFYKSREYEKQIQSLEREEMYIDHIFSRKSSDKEGSGGVHIDEIQLGR